MLNAAMVKYSKFKYKLTVQLFIALILSLAIHAILIALPAKKIKSTLNQLEYSRAIQIHINSGQVKAAVNATPILIALKKSSENLVPEPYKEDTPSASLEVFPSTTPAVSIENNPTQKANEDKPVLEMVGPIGLPFAGFGGSTWVSRSRSQPPQGDQAHAQMQAMLAAKHQRLSYAMTTLYGNLNQNRVALICELRLSENLQIGYLTCEPENYEGMVEAMLGSTGIVWDASVKDKYKECSVIAVGTVKSEKLNCQKGL